MLKISEAFRAHFSFSLWYDNIEEVDKQGVSGTHSVLYCCELNCVPP